MAQTNLQDIERADKTRHAGNGSPIGRAEVRAPAHHETTKRRPSDKRPMGGAQYSLPPPRPRAWGPRALPAGGSRRAAGGGAACQAQLMVRYLTMKVAACALVQASAGSREPVSSPSMSPILAAQRMASSAQELIREASGVVMR